MLPFSVFVILWMGVVTGVSGIPDFDDDYQGYEIIFHHNTNLLLAIHNDSCYYVNTPINKEYTLEDSGPVGHTHLQVTESSLMSHIQKNSSGEVTGSTLDVVRNKFGDILADFHCTDKNIFEVQLYGGATNPNHPQSFCEGKQPGLYADPDNCHQFYQCDGYSTFHESCAPGTGFVESAQVCDHVRNIPNCS